MPAGLRLPPANPPHELTVAKQPMAGPGGSRWTPVPLRKFRRTACSGTGGHPAA